MIAAMEDLLATPDTISDHVEDLQFFAETAASWAKAAPSPSSDLHLAVSLRQAAGELRSYALRSSPVHLMRARRYLEESRDGSWPEARAAREVPDPVSPPALSAINSTISSNHNKNNNRKWTRPSNAEVEILQQCDPGDSSF